MQFFKYKNEGQKNSTFNGIGNSFTVAQRVQKSLTTAAIIGLGLIGPIQSASAAMVTFNNFLHVGSDAVDYIVKVEDDAEAGVSAGSFRITYQVAPSSPNTTAKLTGLFLDLGDPFSAAAGPYTAGNLGFSNESAGDSSCAQDFNTDQVNSMGCNTQLQLPATAGAFQNHQFDIAIAWKKNDISDGSPRSFEIADLGFSVSDFSAVAMRGQATTGSGGSAKEYATANPVPVPASAWFFGSAILATYFAKRRA